MWVIGVKGSRCCAVIDFVEQVGEEVGSVVLALGGGVVVLGLEGGSELDAGLEDRAGFQQPRSASPAPNRLHQASPGRSSHVTPTDKSGTTDGSRRRIISPP